MKIILVGFVFIFDMLMSLADAVFCIVPGTGLHTTETYVSHVWKSIVLGPKDLAKKDPCDTSRTRVDELTSARIETARHRTR